MQGETSSARATTRPRLPIGEWWADSATNELRRGSETVRIEPKAMEVLMLLADHSGHVVSRETLFSAVWPGVVVGDEALTQSIIKLRRALGDNPRSPSYIETISKRGYRLIAPLTRSEAAAAAPGGAGPALPQQPPARKRHRFAWPSVAAGVLLGLSTRRRTSSCGPSDSSGPSAIFSRFRTR